MAGAAAARARTGAAAPDRPMPITRPGRPRRAAAPTPAQLGCPAPSPPTPPAAPTGAPRGSVDHERHYSRRQLRRLQPLPDHLSHSSLRLNTRVRDQPRSGGAPRPVRGGTRRRREPRGRRPDASRGRHGDGDGERAEPRLGRRESASERAPSVARASTPRGLRHGHRASLSPRSRRPPTVAKPLA
jgi:hypothetical protein